MRVAPTVLLLIGLMQMAGDLLHVRAVQAIGAAIGASPAPKVFTSIRGMEGYSTRFFLEWTDGDGDTHVLQLTPEIYQRLKGPYNRRNVYGAVLAGGPVMVSDPILLQMHRSVSHYALCGRSPLLREFGIESADVTGLVRVRYEPRADSTMGNLPRVLQAPCP